MVCYFGRVLRPIGVRVLYGRNCSYNKADANQNNNHLTSLSV